MESDRPREPFTLGLDLGGTNIKGGVVDLDGRALSSVSHPTLVESGPGAALDRLEEVAMRAVAESGVGWPEIGAVGLGSAGTLDTSAGRIVGASNLPSLNGFAIGPALAERLGRPVGLVNDANAAAYGEAWAGAGRGARSLVLFTLGTGIGSGIVEDGRIVEGRHGLGGECGHVTIQMDGGRACTCGLRGHLEAYASAGSLVRRAVEALELEPGSTLRAESDLTARTIAEHAANGDPLAARLMRETARYLAIGASSLIHTVDPELVLFGGGMIEAGPGFLEAIRAGVREHTLPPARDSTRVEFAALGGSAGFIGAAGWAMKQAD